MTVKDSGRINVRDWFYQLIGIELRIKSKKEQIRKYRELATRSTGSFEATRISGTSNRSRVEEAVVSICSAEEAVREELDKLYAFRSDAMAVINAVQDQKYRDILEMRYVTGWSCRRIAEEMHYERRWVEILHGRALNAARAVLRGMPETVRNNSLDIGD